MPGDSVPDLADFSLFSCFETPPICLAASDGDCGILSTLIANGADVNVIDIADFTPLHHACEKGHVCVIHLLLAAGCDVNPSKDSIPSPLTYAARFTMFLQRQASSTCLAGTAPTCFG